ncbi:MAG: M67 family metallopeptidase [Nitrospiraceae bacterium]
MPHPIVEQLIAHARELAPHECCGFLAGTNGVVSHVYRITNVVALEGAIQAASFDDAKLSHLGALSPEERAEIAFVMDSQDMFKAVKDMRKQGLELQVVYHSHPHDPARPSVTDIKIASEWEENWPKFNLPLPAYLLISLQQPDRPDVKLYSIRDHAVQPLPLTVE